jgi:hypothetical protein
MHRCLRSWSLVLPFICLLLFERLSVAAGPYDPIPLQAPSPGDAAIEKALDQPADFEFIETPLDKVVEKLRAKYGIEIHLDSRALEESGVAEGTQITHRFKYFTLRSALNVLLQNLELTSLVKGGTLLITTNSAAETINEIIIYPVEDLILPPESLREPGRRYREDYDRLVETIRCAIAPSSWGDGNNSDAIRAYEGTLVVRSSQDVHAEIADLLAKLRAARDAQFAPAGKPKPASLPTENRSHSDAIDKALGQPVEFDFHDATLSDVLEAIQEKFKIPVTLDNKALEESGVDSMSRVTRRLHGITLAEALDLLLRDLELTWVVRNDVLIITTRSACECINETRVYPIARLGTPGRPAPHQPTMERYDKLLELVHRIVTQDVEGSATVVPNAGALVVSHTAGGHEKVVALLSALRTARERDRTALPSTETTAPGADGMVDLVYPLPRLLGRYEETIPFERPAALPTGKAEVTPIQTTTTVRRDASPAAREAIATKLAAAIFKFVEPKSWDGAGGEGSITIIGDQLLVRQRMAVHDQVVDFLEKFNGCGMGGEGGMY